MEQQFDYDILHGEFFSWGKTAIKEHFFQIQFSFLQLLKVAQQKQTAALCLILVSLNSKADSVTMFRNHSSELLSSGSQEF